MTTSKSTEAELLLTNRDGPKLPPIAASKRIFYVRHGEVIPPGGAHGVFYGCLDVPLSPLGELEAKAAGMFLQQYNVDKIASSPLKRAMFGANQVLKYQNSYEKDIEIYQGFTELDRGEWCGRTKAEIGPDLMARFDNCDETITPKGGESYPALKARVLKSRDELLSSLKTGESAALVSHLQVTRSVLSDALGIPTNKLTEIKVALASITCIDYCDMTGQATVQFSSLKPEAGLEEAKDGGNVV